MKLLAVPLALIILVITGCGGGSSSNTVTVTISPTTTTLTQNQTAQFTATVTNATDTAVAWQVGGVAGGSSSTGTITTTGIYTAPSSISSTFTETITAVSQQDTTKSASATVTLNPTNAAPTPPILISPSSAVLPAGAQQTFVATVSGSSTTVTWSLTCNGQTGPACGVITQDGVYTAPLFPPPTGGATITASVADSSALPGNAPVSIQISNQSLLGSYAFSMAGKGSGGATASAGSISFDGQGNVTGGVVDTRGAAATATITGGDYHVGSDARGVLAMQTTAGPMNWQFVLVNHSHVFIESVDAAGGVLSGSLDAQDSGQFNTAAIQGNYSFLLSGASAANSSGVLVAAGAFTADGAGGIAQGLLDVNDTGSAQTSLALTGSYSAPSAQGRGTMTLSSLFGTQSFIYYLVDTTHLKLMETDAANSTTAELRLQPAGPFATGSFHGVYVAALAGADIDGPVSTGGMFTLNGAGTVSGKIDENNDGNLQSNLAVTGTYSVTDASTGRTTMSWTTTGGTREFVVYPALGNQLNVLEIDTTSAGATALPQLTSGFFNAVFVGNFATQGTGTEFITNPGPQTFLGRLIPNGGSSITGTLAINTNGTLSDGAAFSGTYGFDTAGRSAVIGTLTSSTFADVTLIFYAADANTAVFIESDGDRVLTGIVQRQY